MSGIFFSPLRDVRVDRLERALPRLLPPFEPGLRGQNSQEEVGLCRSGRGGRGGAVQARNFFIYLLAA